MPHLFALPRGSWHSDPPMLGVERATFIWALGGLCMAGGSSMAAHTSTFAVHRGISRHLQLIVLDARTGDAYLPDLSFRLRVNDSSRTKRIPDACSCFPAARSHDRSMAREPSLRRNDQLYGYVCHRDLPCTVAGANARPSRQTHGKAVLGFVPLLGSALCLRSKRLLRATVDRPCLGWLHRCRRRRGYSVFAGGQKHRISPTPPVHHVPRKDILQYLPTPLADTSYLLPRLLQKSSTYLLDRTVPYYNDVTGRRDVSVGGVTINFVRPEPREEDIQARVQFENASPVVL